MLRKPLSLAVLSCFLLACEPAPNAPSDTETEQASKSSIRLVESRTASGEGLAIPYEKYQLENGLTVILHEDHSDPLVHVDVTYHVGSSRESIGYSGFAHFFEHMMFQGSANVADELHFKIITEAGGDLNGTTNSDRTNYYQTVPANQLEKVLWLESDRMGFLLEAVTQEKFEVQRETVKNERAQRVDNQPYGLRQERIAEAMYPEGHPYSWPVIGYIEDLNRVSVKELKSFFQRWYGPNNATLTIGGDLDKAQTLAWVEQYFGPIAKGPDVDPLDKALVTLPEKRYLTLEDKVHLPLLQITFPTVYARHEDEAPLDVLSNILGGGRTSLFYKNLVKEGIAVQAVVSHPCRELACDFQLIALANPSSGKTLADIEKVIEASIDEFVERGVNQDDLDRTKTSIEAGTVFGLQSVAGKVSALAASETFYGQPDLVQSDLDRYAAVTKEDVIRVFKKYIQGKPSVVLSIVPEGQLELAAKIASYTIPERVIPELTDEEFANVPAVKDNFDRSVQPKAGINPAVKVPDFWTESLDNNITVIGHKTSETPTVTMTLSMEGGPLLDPIDKSGLASFTAQLLNESTSETTAEELSNQLALLGSRIDFSANGRFSQMSVSSLTRNFDKTLAIVQEKLFKPGFKEEEFELLKQQTLQGMQQQLKNADVLGNRAVSQLMYGKHNRIGLPNDGTLESIAGLTLDDVKAFYNQYYTSAKTTIIVVGDIEQKKVISDLSFLTSWSNAPYDIPPYKAFPELLANKVYLVDKPGAAQAVVKFIKRTAPYDALGENFKSKLMNFALGGNFNSRINLNLREDKGYTYGAFSQFSGGKTLGHFEMGASVKQENTYDAIVEFVSELDRYQQAGMSEAELESMRLAYTQSDALNYETPNSKAGFLRHLTTYDLDRDYRSKQLDIINSIELSELNALATGLKSEDLALIVVGDAAVLKPQLEKLDREIETLSVVQ
ncbi:insulinase family protein [Alteromonadaceae bacterium M269]|nr:insulinase family protein [Alteromonadaceae bacterium M269]